MNVGRQVRDHASATHEVGLTNKGKNVTWIQGVKDKGYNVIDIGADKSGKSSTFYNMEKLKVY